MPPAALELASAPALPPASRTSLRAAHTSSRQQPATEPQPSVSPPASPAARAEPGRGAGGQRGHQGRDGAAKQPRPGPRRLRNLNTHAHTRAHAGQSVRPEESEGAFTALHSFPKGEVPFTRAPPSRHPRRLQEGQLRHASSPPAHTPTPSRSSTIASIPLHSLEPGREHASPGAADGQPFSRGPRRARRPEVAGTGGEGPPPLLSAGASGRLGRAPRSSNLPRLGALASSLSAWAAAAATEPGAPRGVRLCAASAGPDSLRQPRRCPRCPAGTRRGAGAPSQTSSRRSSPPPPPRLAPNLYLRSPSPTPEPLRLRLRGSAPSPAPQAPHPGRVNLTPRAQGGKVWE
ncbi:hypothetical protein GH733_001234 [Mirounga leonina]|nr:hypothetical protein GH733_001234 [Mirounga leonina]